MTKKSDFSSPVGGNSCGGHLLLMTGWLEDGGKTKTNEDVKGGGCGERARNLVGGE